MDDEKNFGPNFFRFPQIVPVNHVRFIRFMKEKKRKENRYLRIHFIVGLLEDCIITGLTNIIFFLINWKDSWCDNCSFVTKRMKRIELPWYTCSRARWVIQPERLRPEYRPVDTSCLCLFRKCRPVRRIDEISYNVNLRLIRSSCTCCGADSYTAGQRWVLYMHHVEFTILGDQGGGRECDHTAGRDGEKGVYNGPLLIVSFESGTVERWPEQP